VRVGLAYDLKAEHLARGLDPEDAAELDEADTIDALDDAFRRLGHVPDRIGSAEALAARLAAGDRWDLVFNLCEGVRGSCRESQAPALMELFGQPFTGSSAYALAICHHKPAAKRELRDADLATPNFAEIRDAADLDGPAVAALRYPMFVKPAAEGSGKGIAAASKATNPAELRRAVCSCLERFRQPALVEEYLPGDEYTVGVVGTGAEARVIGVMAVDFVRDDAAGVYSLHTKSNYLDLVKYRLADDAVGCAAGELALAAHRRLDCRDFARHDIRCDAAGIPHFLEVNPLPGLNPRTSDLPILCGLAGIGYGELIGLILDAARRRLAIKESR